VDCEIEIRDREVLKQTTKRNNKQPVRSSCLWDSPAAQERSLPSFGGWVVWPCQWPLSTPHHWPFLSRGWAVESSIVSAWPNTWVRDAYKIYREFLYLVLFTLFFGRQVSLTRNVFVQRYTNHHRVSRRNDISLLRRRFRQQYGSVRSFEAAASTRILDKPGTSLCLVCDGRKVRIRVSFERSHHTWK